MSVLVLRVSLTLFNLQGARRFSRGEMYLSTSRFRCQEEFFVFQTFFVLLSVSLPRLATARIEYHAPPIMSSLIFHFFKLFLWGSLCPPFLLPWQNTVAIFCSLCFNKKYLIVR